MRRNAKSITAAPEIINHIDGLTEANFKLLTRLARCLAVKEERQKKYRVALLSSIARIEHITSLLLVDQMARLQDKSPWYLAEKLEEDAKETDEIIARKSEQAVLNMIRYIYGGDSVPEVRKDRRRRWSGWEI